MVRLRIFDDRMIKMQRTGKLSFYMQSFGEECIAIAQTMALNNKDWIFPTYRQPEAQICKRARHGKYDLPLHRKRRG